MKFVSRIAVFGLPLALLAALALLLSGPAYRFGWLGLHAAFGLMQYAAFGAVAAAALSLLALVLRRQDLRAVLRAAFGVVVGTIVAWIPWHQLQIARSLPPIHDISTDTDNPPVFVAILLLRKGAPNPAEYGGPALAAQQKRAYPELAPLRLAQPQSAIFTRALAAARGMGWDIVADDAASGRIEATATTVWFGFKDDVVVRVTAEGKHGSRIDVRSVSRLGQSDVGANAARIRAYLAAIEASGQ